MGVGESLDDIIDVITSRVRDDSELFLAHGEKNRLASDSPCYTPYTNIAHHIAKRCSPQTWSDTFSWHAMTHIRAGAPSTYDPGSLMQDLSRVVDSTPAHRVHPSFYHHGRDPVRVEVPFTWYDDQEDSELLKVSVYPDKWSAWTKLDSDVVVPSYHDNGYN